jgi:hypothetical protein
LAALGVLSALPNRQRRDAVRATWMRVPTAATFVIRFVVGWHPAMPETALELQREQRDNSDDMILLPNNATSKRAWAPLVSLFRWLCHASSEEPYRSAAFVAKLDDDVYVHLPELAAHLRLMQSASPTPHIYCTGCRDQCSAT